jgi:hypothetical protein
MLLHYTKFDGSSPFKLLSYAVNINNRPPIHKSGGKGSERLLASSCTYSRSIRVPSSRGTCPELITVEVQANELSQVSNGIEDGAQQFVLAKI